MRIMQISSGMLVNGAVLQCLEITKELQRRGHQLTVACRPGAWIAKQLADTTVTVVCSELRSLPKPDTKLLAQYAINSQIEVIHTHQSRAHVAGILIRFRSGIPCVATAHARHFQPHWPLNNYVIANSQATLDYHARWNLVRRKKMEVVKPLMDLARFANVAEGQRATFREKWGYSAGQLVVGIVGDIIPRKDHLTLVRAWRTVSARVPQARLAIIGNEKDKQYAANVRLECERLNLGDSVQFVGYQEDMPSVMAAIDLCVSTAVEEALGLTILEAMAAGRTVVATNVGGVPESVLDGVTGLLVPAKGVEAISKAIMELLKDESRRDRLAKKAQESILRSYDRRTQIETIERIYRSVAHKSQAPAQRAA